MSNFKPNLRFIKLPSEPGIDSLLQNNISSDTNIVAIPDNEAAAPGLDALARASAWIPNGYRVAIHLNCRDRNRIDIVSRYNGAVFLKGKYIVVETGFHTRQGSVPEAKPVYDLDPLQCLHLLSHLQKNTRSGFKPLLGLRTSVQKLDNFEINRINQICRAHPHFLIIHSNRSLDFVTKWIDHCGKITGFTDVLLIWEPGLHSSNPVKQMEHVPEGIHGMFYNY